MAAKTVAGKLGGFLQVAIDDARLIISQVTVTDGLDPPQMSSLENPLDQIRIYKVW
jgi:hypothetical protein